MSGWEAVQSFAPWPALYLLALAGGLAWVLRRWFDPVPGKVLLFFLALLALLFAPVLAGDAVLLPVGTLRYHAPYQVLAPAEPPAIALQRDLVHQIAPWALEVKRALLAGGWPLWNPHQGAGTPLLADPQAQPFQPLVALAYPFDIWTAAGLTAALKVLVALVFGFLLLRRQGLGDAAAVCGSAGFALGGFIMLWLGWPIASCAALLPLVLYAVVRCDDCGGRRDFLLLAAAAAALLLGGHPETLTYCLGLIGVFLLDRCRVRQARDHARAQLLRGNARAQLLRGAGWRGLLLPATLALALGAAAAAPVLLPTAQFLPGTQRSVIISNTIPPQPLADFARHLLEPETLEAWSDRAVHRLVPAFAPNAFGDQRNVYWGESNYLQDAALFTGSLTFAFAGVALAGLASPRRRRFPQERLMGVVLLASVALLAQPPGFDRLAIQLPLLGPTAVHKHQRIQVVVALALCYLAACQVERWVRREARGRTLALGLALTLAAVACAYLGNGNPDRPGDPWDFRIHWLWVQAGFLLLGALLLLAARLAPGIARRAGVAGWRGRVRVWAERWAPWALAGAIAAELLLFYLPANPPNPRRLAFPAPPPVRFLAARLHRSGDRLAGAGTALPANFASVYGLSDVRVDNPSVPDLYARTTRMVNRGILEPIFNRLGHPLFDLLGVRYVITRPGVKLPFPLVFADRSGWVWERPHPLPRLFLPERAQPYRGGNFEDWLESNADFGFRALVQPTPAFHRKWRSGRPEASRLQLERTAATRVSAHAALAEPRLLASSVYQDGGWRVLAGGRALPVLYVNGPFTGAFLPAGEAAVELLYRPAAFLAGCLLAALAVAGGLAWWVPPPTCQERRSIAGVPATCRECRP